jgi:hypothetical protein
MNPVQFSRYISTPSTTTATSATDLEPPNAPPPPPPLSIPPSRARRQLAARLALHSKQNAQNSSSVNREHADSGESAGDQNPFAAAEDEDSDDGEGDFTIGDAEGEEDGKGKSQAGTSLSHGQESLLGGGSGKNVGIPSSSSGITFPPASASVLGRGRATFPSLWPFGGSSKASNSAEPWEAEMMEDASSKGHFRGWSANDEQSSDEDSDGEYGGAMFGDDRPRRPKRRLSSTTEAKRRTSLEDDDEDEVVHVGMAEVPEKSSEEKGGVGDDEELVEIQHTEMPGVAGGQQ